MLRNARKTKGLLPFILMLCCCFSCKTEKSSTKSNTLQIEVNQLLGKWRSSKNTKNVIELTKSRMFSFYDGLKLADESLVIYQNCVSKCVPEGIKAMPCLVTDGKRAENCFRIVELTEKRLSYSLIGQEDKVMTFEKM